MGQPLLRTTDITKTRRRYSWRRGSRTLIYRDLEVWSGEIVALKGENGAGKSTFLSICAGVLAPDRGGDVTRAGKVGFCPQMPPLLDLLSAEEHLRYFCLAKGINPRKGVQEGKTLLSRLSFRGTSDSANEDLVHDSVKDLSGGNRQKVNLVLALLGNPKILLLDEPDQGFDARTKRVFWAEFIADWANQDKAVIVVTHDDERTLQDHGLGISLRTFDPRFSMA
jgi:ABC-type multidrug transport system ATPase subunit